MLPYPTQIPEILCNKRFSFPHTNIYRSCLFVFLTLLILSSCSCCRMNNSQNQSAKLSLIKESDSLYYLRIVSDSATDPWKLPYPVYRYETGDIDHDGSDEMLVGVIKAARFDSGMRKRLFIFRNYEGCVRPLWLGSLLGAPLEDFRLYNGKEGSRVRCIEKEISGKYMVAEYAWNKFGLDFKRYIQREITLENARVLLNK
jgi:hypothetical protein